MVVNAALLRLLEDETPDPGLKHKPLILTGEDIEQIQQRWPNGLLARSKLRELIKLGYCRLQEGLNPLTVEERQLLQLVAEKTREMGLVEFVGEIFSCQRFLRNLEEYLRKQRIACRLATAKGSLREVAAEIIRGIPPRHRRIERAHGRPSAEDYLGNFPLLHRKGITLVFVADIHTLTKEDLWAFVDACDASPERIDIGLFSLQPVYFHGIGICDYSRYVYRKSRFIEWLAFFEGIRHGLILARMSYRHSLC